MPRTAVKQLTLRAILPLAVALFVFGAAAVVVYAASGNSAVKQRSTKTFTVSGNVTTALNPGRIQPIEVVLRNGKARNLWIKRLNVRISIDSQHAALGCNAMRDFAIVQLPGTVFPLKLPGKPNTKRFRNRYGPSTRLKELGITQRPKLWMRNLARVNQDGCKGAALTLHFYARVQDVEPPNTHATSAPPSFAFGSNNPGRPGE